MPSPTSPKPSSTYTKEDHARHAAASEAEALAIHAREADRNYLDNVLIENALRKLNTEKSHIYNDNGLISVDGRKDEHISPRIISNIYEIMEDPQRKERFSALNLTHVEAVEVIRNSQKVIEYHHDGHWMAGRQSGNTLYIIDSKGSPKTTSTPQRESMYAAGIKNKITAAMRDELRIEVISTGLQGDGKSCGHHTALAHLILNEMHKRKQPYNHNTVNNTFKSVYDRLYDTRQPTANRLITGNRNKYDALAHVIYDEISQNKVPELKANISRIVGATLGKERSERKEASHSPSPRRTITRTDVNRQAIEEPARKLAEIARRRQQEAEAKQHDALRQRQQEIEKARLQQEARRQQEVERARQQQIAARQKEVAKEILENAYLKKLIAQRKQEATNIGRLGVAKNRIAEIPRVENERLIKAVNLANRHDKEAAETKILPIIPYTSKEHGAVYQENFDRKLAELLREGDETQAYERFKRIAEDRKLAETLNRQPNSPNNGGGRNNGGHSR